MAFGAVQAYVKKLWILFNRTILVVWTGAAYRPPGSVASRTITRRTKLGDTMKNCFSSAVGAVFVFSVLAFSTGWSVEASAQSETVLIRVSADDFAALRDVDVVFNAAALKQVPTCEYAPFEA